MERQFQEIERFHQIQHKLMFEYSLRGSVFIFDNQRSDNLIYMTSRGHFEAKIFQIGPKNVLRFGRINHKINFMSPSLLLNTGHLRLIGDRRPVHCIFSFFHLAFVFSLFFDQSVLVCAHINHCTSKLSQAFVS